MIEKHGKSTADVEQKEHVIKVCSTLSCTINASIIPHSPIPAISLLFENMVQGESLKLSLFTVCTFIIGAGFLVSFWFTKNL